LKQARKWTWLLYFVFERASDGVSLVYKGNNYSHGAGFNKSRNLALRETSAHYVN